MKERNTMIAPNLADLLTVTAAARPDDVAIKRDERALTYAALDAEAARVAGLLRAKGVRPGDRVGIMLPNVEYFPICYYGALRAGAAVVPMNVLLKEREVAFHLGDSGASVLLAWHAFADAAHAGADQTGAECVLVEPGEFDAMLDRCAPLAEVVPRDSHDTAVIPLHLRHDRHAEGRRAHPREPAAQRRGERRGVRPRRADRDARRASAVPRLRPDVRAQRHHRGRRVPHAHPPLRRDRGARDPRTRPRDRLRGRADDVRRDAALSARHGDRHVDARGVRVRRRGDAGRAHARLRGAVRLPGPRGLRALGDLAARVVQPTRPRAQARL